MKQSLWKRVLSLALALVLVGSYFPTLSTSAATPTASYADAYGGTDNKITDPATVNNWKLFFDISDPNDLDTTYAGGVWTDKSVFNSVQEYLAATDEAEGTDFGLTMNDPNNFLVALSAIASTKSVEGYSALPSDTILVLDLSASMITNQAVSALVQSANDAITRLQTLNANNRVGVVAYSGNASAGASGTGTAEVILPLGRYTPGLDSSNNSAYLVSSWVTGSGRQAQQHTGVKVASGVTGTVAGGVTSTFSEGNSKDASGGTYIQNGLYQAWQMFSQVAETSIQSGLQAGVDRVPVMVLLSDGAPTAATTAYTNVQTSNVGNGTSTYATTGTAFLTQLTASWVRDKMAQKYGTDPLVYTLGLGVGSNTAAKNLLDPSNNTETDALWTQFRNLATAADQEMTVEIATIRDRNNSETITADIEYTAPVNAADGWSEDYVTEYFPATNAAGLIQAFSDIVQQIVIQSLYYPTMVESGNTINEDGFLVFDDYIGKNMEVKAIKGIQLGTTLYSGQTLAKMIYQGGMGTVENPTDAGNNLVWSVQKRLGIDTVENTRTLIGQAYSAGQLAYDPDTGAFSNYIGWYADKDEKFIGFWDGKDSSPEAVPSALRSTAVYAIKSYGFYDAVGEGHRKTDMMYATIQVRTTVATPSTGASEVGDMQVIGKLPASLIPLVEYNVQLNGADVMDPTAITVSGATSPSRLLYEVGLRSEIDLLDIAGTAPDALETDANGNYVFYTNQWHGRGNYSYATNKNTISYFSPSIENERYYYNYDTPIYSDQNGTLYTGTAAPVYSDATPCYHRSITYYKDGSTVRAGYEYEQISQYVLDDTTDLKKLDDNTWVVKRGTLHHYFADYQIDKNDNATGTLDVSFMPFVHDLNVSAEADFHVDFYLGDNGKLTIDPAEGIKVSKVADDTITDKTADYTFTVTALNSTFNETVQFVKEDANGVRTESTRTFQNNKATFTLKHGETAWLLGTNMVGHTFKVTETEGTDFVVSSVNGIGNATFADLAVSANNIASAAFVNTRMHTGSVIIGKGVVSTIADHQNKEFEFTLTITGDKLVVGRSYTATRSDGQTYALVAGTGTTVTLKHNQYITLSGLPEGTNVTATEADYSGVGFTVNQATQTKVIAADSTVYLNFQNTYAADPVTVGSTITVGGTKHMVSDVDISGSFTFNLDRYIYADGSYEPVPGSTATVTYTAEKGDKGFTLDFDGETYSATGTYYYRVTEVRDATLAEAGIIFDATPFYFDVVVADDGEGNHYISNVIAGTDATVTGDRQNGWNVTGEFTNTYAVNGAAKVVLNMQKKVTSQHGVTIPPAGFSFELFEADADFNSTNTTPVATSSVTGAGGLADIQLIYDDDATDIGTHNYVLQEVVPAGAVNRFKDGVTYVDTKYGVEVEVDHQSSYFTLTVNTYTLSASGATLLNTYTGTGTQGVISVSTDALEFVNDYKPESVSVPIDIHKSLDGADLNNFSFQYEFTQVSDRNGTDGGFPVLEDSLTGLNTELVSISSAGVSYWRVREVIPNGAVNNRLNGVTYDPSVYIVEVNVAADNINGVLIPTVTIYKDGQVVPAIVFENVYTAAPVDVTLEATKHLTGYIRKLQANAYHFELVDSTGTVVQTVGNGIPTGDYDAPVTFETLSFDAPGTYNYTIREVLHPDAKAENSYTVHGVKYDTTKYPVVITVTDPGNGQLTANVEYQNLPQGYTVPHFVNTYSVAPTSYTLSAKKELDGDRLENHQFLFTLFTAHWDAVNKTVVQGAPLAKVRSDNNGDIVFSALNFDAIGAYRFILREELPVSADPLMKYDTSVFYYEIDVTDNLFGGLTASAEVTKVNAHGEATEVSDTAVAFHNEFAPEPVSVPLDGLKLYNKDLPAGTFSFDLYQAMADDQGNISAIGSPLLTATNKDDGTFLFEEKLLVDVISGKEMMSSYMTFEKAGTYYFVIKEQIPDGADANNVLDGVEYDATIHEITVTVTESIVNGRTVLSYQTQINGDSENKLVFINNYTASAEDGVVISGKKVLKGGDLKDGDFSFGLYLATVESDGTVVIGELIETVKNVGDTFTFKEITYPSYDNVGIHFYVVKEQIPKGVDKNNTLGQITYDDSTYLVVVQVEDNDDGTLSVYGPVCGLVEEDGKPADNPSSQILITNTYTPKPVEQPETPDTPKPPADNDKPKTGDDGRLGLWVATLAASSLALAAALIAGKKKETR